MFTFPDRSAIRHNFQIKMMNWEKILTFWFGKEDEQGYGKPRQEWFAKNPQFDQQVLELFMDIYQLAKKEELDSWKNNPLSCLALIIILDQFPRNIFRGEATAFATDHLALKYAKYAIDQSFDTQLLPVQRWFIYLPFEHSENLADQQRSLELFSTLKDDPDSKSTIDYAARHLEIIQRFGRFPHRNAILGRITTPEEEEFLKQPGSKF